MSQSLSIDLATALDVKLAAEQEAKFQALRTLHNSKVKLLTLSLDNKEKEITKLKILNKDNRRTQMIEAYKAKIKDLELTIDVLKTELVNRAGITRDAVNDIIMLKTISGPKRFRPLTREELEKNLSDLERQLKRANKVAAANATQQGDAAGGGGGENRSVVGSVAGSVAGSVKKSGGTLPSRPNTANSAVPPTPSIPNKAFTSTGPSRVEDITQIANLSHQLASLQGALEVSQVTIDNQKEEISKLKMRVSQLCTVEEDAEFQERQFKELKITYDALSNEFNEISLQLGRAVNENVQLRSRIEVEAEQNDNDRDAMTEQCDKFLRQNSLLLQRLADMEAEIDKKGGVDASGRRLSRANSATGDMGGAGGGAGAGAPSQLEMKVNKLTEKLKDADAQIAKMQSDLQAVNELKNALREKNVQIMELQKQVPPKKSKTAAGSGAAAASELPASSAEDVSGAAALAALREENEQLKKALSAAASDSIRSAPKKAESKGTGATAGGPAGGSGGVRDSMESKNNPPSDEK